MNQQAIDRVKERLSKYLKRTDDSDKSYDNGYCKALEHTLEDLQALGDGWILWNDEKPVAKQLINMFNIHNGNINVGKVMQIEIDSKVPPYTHWMPLQLPPNK